MTQVRNLYALLAFAMRDMGLIDDVRVGSCDFEKPLEVLALLIDRACYRAFRRGVDRAYQSRDDQGPQIHGRIDIGRTAAGMLDRRGQLAFELEELQRDTPCNRIIKRGLHDLIRAEQVPKSLRARLSRYAAELHEVGAVDERGRANRVQFPRGNEAYRIAVFIADLVREQALPDAGERGRASRWGPTNRDMAQLFEGFVRGVTAHLLGSRHRVCAREPKWRVEQINARATALLPAMRTDVHVTAPDGRVGIIECKFYEEPLQSGRAGAEKRFRSGHLYQLLAYLHAQEHETRPRGLLAYAHHAVSFDERFTLDGFEVRLATIDLNAPWSALRGQMVELAGWVGGVNARGDILPRALAAPT